MEGNKPKASCEAPKDESAMATDEEAQPMQQETIVHDDGVFTLTIGPSSSSGVDSAVAMSDGAAAAVQIVAPSPRMSCGMSIRHGSLYVYGGIVEDGDKQFFLNDMYSLGKIRVTVPIS